MRTDNIASIAKHFLIVGMLIFAIGIWGLLSESDPTVMCDGERLAPGDTCISTWESRSGTYDELAQRYDESDLWNPQWTPWIIGVGAVLMVGAAGTLTTRYVLAAWLVRVRPPADSDWWIGTGPTVMDAAPTVVEGLDRSATTGQRPPRTEQVPPEALEAAADAELGTHRALFTQQPPIPVGWTLGFLAFVAAVVLTIGILVGDGWDIAGFVVAGLCLPLSAWALFLDRTFLAVQVYVFEHGMIQRGSDGVFTVLPWANIRVLRNITRHYVNGRYTRTSFVYTVQRPGSRDLTLGTNKFGTEEIRVLGELVEQRIAAVRLPRALEWVTAGKRIEFGDLTIDIHGISDRHSTFPWHEVEKIDTVNGSIRIKRAGTWLTWSRTPVRYIPDVVVLLTLADALHRLATT